MTKKATPKPAKTRGKGRGAPKKVPKKAATAKKPSQATARSRGRPTSYSDALAKAICGWVRQGYTLRQIESLANMPSKSTIIRWLGEHEDFQDQYVRAHEVQSLLMLDEITEIADDSRNDWIERESKDGDPLLVVNEEAISRAKVRIDARKWLMEKKAPKRFGRQVAVTGKDGGPVEHRLTTVAGVLEEINGAGTGLPDHATTGD